MTKVFKVGAVDVLNQHSFPIGMDAIILALLPNSTLSKTDTVLDLCAGSGIVSMVLTQKFQIQNLTALELSSQSALECKKNYSSIGLVTNQVKEGDFHMLNQFECNYFSHIYVNPPYFLEGIPTKNWAQATHTNIDKVHALLRSIHYWLKPYGNCSFILPAQDLSTWRRLIVQNNLFIQEVYPIASYHLKHPNRYILKLTKENQLQPHEYPKFHIMEEDGKYSSDYIQLTKTILCLKQ